MSRLIPTAALVALIGAAAPCASAQTPPSGGVSSLDVGQAGISVGVDPQKGVSAEVGAGESAGLSLEAGPGGAKLDLRQGAVSVPPVSTPAQPTGRESGDSAQPAGGGNSTTTTPATGDGAAAAPASGARRARGDVSGSGRDAAGGPGAGDPDPAGAGDRRDAGASPASERAEERGVAPFLDFIEQVPRAVWAGLVALALIALALWLMWVRGRRRLERNAWVDAETGAMNVVAFETVLAQEWTRSGRYRRPLGLLLLDLEEDASDGGRKPLGDKRARRAWEAITARVREADTVAQLSASRFAVICPESPHGSVETLARALESALEGEQLHARVGAGERFESDRGPADLVSRAAGGLASQGAWAGAPDAVPHEEPRALHAAA